MVVLRSQFSLSIVCLFLMKRRVVRARSVLCYLAVGKLRMSVTKVALRLNITPSAVSKPVVRGQSIAMRKESKNP